ncbi:MAG: hypothetical protein WCI51_13490 [Lentisphaerota bacterium]
MDRLFWEYLEELPEHEAAWKEWQSGLMGWHSFNTLYTHYLRVEGRRVKLLNCPAPCVVNYFNYPDNHQISLRFKNGAIASLNFVMYIGETNHDDPLLEMLEKQSDDGHYLQYHIFGTKGAIETDVFRRRIRRWEFSDSPKQMVSRLAETIHFTKEEDQLWFHNTHGQNLRIAELVAKGLPPETTAIDSYQTMVTGFAAEKSERERRIVKMSEMNL